ncbi:MAG: glycosyltransferase family 2 protein [Gaiellaceae bacterium]
MRVSIVVTTFNAEAWIEAVVSSLRVQTHRNLEILVVDDGSSDSTVDIAERLQLDDGRIRVLRNPHGGTAAAVNRGLEEARGEIVSLLSHDCYAEPDWISRAHDAFASQDLVGIVRGPVLPSRRISIPFYHCMVVDHASPSFDGVCIAYRAAALDRAGRYFDRELSRSGDDADLGWRILEVGYRQMWLDQPIARHEVVPRDPWSGLSQSFGVYRFPLLVRRHPALRSHLTLRCLWGGRARPAKFLLAHAVLAGAVAGRPRLTGAAASLLCFAAAAESARTLAQIDVSCAQRWLAMPLEKLLRDIISTYALAYGSLHYRSPVL